MKKEKKSLHFLRQGKGNQDIKKRNKISYKLN